MKSLQEAMSGRNYPYNVVFIIDGKQIPVQISLSNIRDSKEFDEWLENQIDDNIYHAGGGPNDIEL